jgi:exopolysaccharide production protein ExoZ
MYNSLQVLRGLAAWAVVLHHIVQSYYMGNVTNVVWGWFHSYGRFGVDVFFILSGFVMALTATKYNGSGIVFLINRLFRVFPIYWFYTFVLLLSLYILPNGTFLVAVEFKNLILSLLLIPNDNPNGYGIYPTLYVGWTLTFEVFFYMVFSFVLISKKSQPILICTLVLIFFTVVFRNYHFLGHGTYLLMEFVCGLALYKLCTYEAINLKYRILSLGVLLLLSAVSYWSEQFFVLRLLLSTSLVLLFILLEPFFQPNKTNFLRKLGDYSYSTYLCHVIVIGWFYAIKEQFSLPTGNVGMLCGILFFTYIVSKITYNGIEVGQWIYNLKIKLIQRVNK